MKVKLIQYSGIPVRITNRCKQNSAGSTQYDRQRVLRPINRRIASPVKVGVFNARSVASRGKSQSISTWIPEHRFTAAGLVETSRRRIRRRTKKTGAGDSLFARLNNTTNMPTLMKI